MSNTRELSNTSESSKAIATVGFGALAVGTLFAWQSVSIEQFDATFSRSGLDTDWQGLVALLAGIAGAFVVQTARGPSNAGWAIVAALTGLLGPVALYLDPDLFGFGVSLAAGWYISVIGGVVAAAASLVLWADLRKAEAERRQTEFPRLDNFPRL
jgi:hypothetical protein